LHLISGLYDLNVMLGTEDAKALKLNEEIIKKFSPKNHVETLVRRYKNTKILLIVGSAESPKYRTESKEFYEKLKKQNENVELVEIPERDHFTILSSLWDDVTHPIIKFINKSINA